MKRFMGTFWDACVHGAWLLSRTEAQVIIEGDRQQDHEERPHSRVDHRTPTEKEHKPMRERNVSWKGRSAWEI